MTDRVKGFMDFTGEEAVKRVKIKRIIEDTFLSYGFEPAETPVIEQESFVRGDNTNDEAVSDIFKLSDRGKRKLALRYEFTFQLKRLMKNQKLPYKRYQIGPVFRDEPVAGNRLRQFTQCDVDVIGSKVRDEAEVLAIAGNILKKLKIDSVIYINNRKLLNEILEKEKVNKKDFESVIREIDKLDKLSEAEVKINLKKYGAEKIISIFKKPETFFKKYKSYKDIEELQKYCKFYKVKVTFLPSLARGLSYYNGNIFEVKTKTIKETITSGGSYNFNNKQSTGISFGLERLSLLTKIDTSINKTVIISLDQDKKVIDLAEKLRSEGVSCITWSGKVGKGMEYANKIGANYIIIIGKQEVMDKKLKVKDMKTGKEKSFEFGDVSKGLK